jgi:UDP-glucuronate decarboxylase
MRVLVTGAAGFLGSHLMLHHLRAGDDVVGVDNFCSSKRVSRHLSEIEALHGHVHECDIRDTVLLQMVAGRPDLIYNFACPASPPVYQAMPVETLLTCTAGVANILALAMACGARVVQASTSEVYGNPSISPQPETYRGNVNSYGPRACYDEGKRAAEALCFDFLGAYGVDVRIVRIFNTYGPHMDLGDGRVVTNMIGQALRGEPLTIFGDGRQTRSFCYVDDLIRGIVALGALPVNPYSPVNIGNPHEFTIRELADIVSELVATCPLTYATLALPVDDPAQRRPDITLASSLLAWLPRIELREGIARTASYFTAMSWSGKGDR